jgi:DNA-binding winged helix-turn-helix (wHTH) protein/tetratricopeptide (TPR) repeat protein
MDSKVSSGAENRYFEFGPFTIDPAHRLLTRRGKSIPLAPKAFDTLMVLVEHSGKLVGKEELIKSVWPETEVEEGNLTFNIHVIRKALGANPKEHKYILTVPGKGYRFVGEVRELSGSSTQPKPPESGPAAAAKSIAILPFKSLGSSAEDEYLGVGAADALITRLGNLRQIVVRPTSAVKKYAAAEVDPLAAGRELGVESVLEGSIRRSGDRIRLTVQLSNVADGASIWAEKFDTEFTDVFTVEDTISQQVADALMLRLTGEEKRLLARRYTENAAAFQAYLKGRYVWNKRTEDGLRRAIEQFDNAIGEDPGYALAYAGLADCYGLLSLYGVAAPNECFPRSKAAAARALEIDPLLAEAHTSLAYAHLFYDWDFPAAERQFKRAIELNPNYATARHWYHEYLTQMGRLDEAMVQINLARELDPLSPVINAAMVLPLMNGGQYDEAIRRLKRVIDLEPGFYRTHLFLGLAYVQKREMASAFKEIEEAITLSEGSTRAVALLGWAYAVSGNRARAEEILVRLKRRMNDRYVPPYAMVLIYTALGEKEKAFEWLEKGYDERDEFLTRIKIAPELVSLRTDPRFHDLLRRVGFDRSKGQGLGKSQ